MRGRKQYGWPPGCGCFGALTFLPGWYPDVALSYLVTDAEGRLLGYVNRHKGATSWIGEDPRMGGSVTDWCGTRAEAAAQLAAWYEVCPWPKDAP